MKTGWQTIGGKKYYLGGANDGAMKTGWQTIVKMLVTRARTERPHGALLQFDTGIRYCTYRIGGRLRTMDASL